MSLLPRLRQPVLLRVSAVTVTALLLLTTALANVASAHGNVVSPPSRNYDCWQRWGTNHMAPQMATEDPMCFQAWQANPNAMWNWNGLFREGVGGNHQAAIPNGTLCSGGRTEGGRYNALDAVGNWRATNISNNFSVRLFDQASHGADYIRVYVTRQGFNPTTQPLGWSNLELVSQIGNTPAAQWEVANGGVAISVNANAPGRTGRHIVYTIWQASHLDQSYYFCSDVNFGGTGGGTSPSPGVSPSPSTSPSTGVSPSPSTSPSGPGDPGGAGGCTVRYSVASQWPGNFQADVRVTAGSAAIRGWTVAWTFADGQQIQQSWNAGVTSGGSTVTARNTGYNGALAAGASTNFGFIGTWNGTNAAPVPTCTAS